MPPKKKKERTGANQKRGPESSKDPESGVAQVTAPNALLGHSNNEISREALESEGWKITQVPHDMRRCHVPLSRRIPSPLTSRKDLNDESMKMINTYVHNGVRRLYGSVRADTDRIAHGMLGEGAISEDGAFPYLCVLSGTDGEPEIYDGPRQDADMLGIPLVGLATGPALRSKERTPSLDGNAGKNLDIRLLQNIRNNEFGYFVVNADLEHLAVNESAVGRNLIAGPLPDFAVITVGSIAVFWWRTLSALKYSPDPQPSIHHQPTTPSLKGACQGPRPRKERRPSKTWQDILKDGLERHRRADDIDGKTRLDRVQIADTSNMELTDVWLAIGTIWDALRNLSPKVLNAYARLENFAPVQHLEGVHPAAGQGETFIMPLLFPPAQINENFVGHLILAVAHLEVKGEQRTVHMDIYNSDTNYVDNRTRRQRTKEIIKMSKWANRKGHDEDETPHFAPEDHIETPQQQPGSNTCGMYTVLNAWAVMLGIPIRPYTRRRGETSHEEFARVGQDVINLALAGHMDSRTIQAFMNVYGYTVPQHPDDEEDNVKYDVEAVRMQYHRLTRRVIQQVVLDQDLPPSKTPSPDTPNAPTTIHITIENIATIMGLGATEDEAIEALRNSRNDVQDAAAKFCDSLPKNPDGSTQSGPSTDPGSSS